MNRQLDQRKRIEMDPKIYESLVYGKIASWITGAKIDLLFCYFIFYVILFF